MHGGVSRSANDPLRRLGAAASVVILLAACACAGVLFRAVTQLHPGVSTSQILVFYVVPGVFAVGLLGALYLASESRINLALLLVALASSAVGSEAFLIFRARATSGLPLRPSGDVARPQSLYNVVQDLRAGGARAYPRVPGSILLEMGLRVGGDPRLVYPLAPAPGGVTVVLCNENGSPISYQGDRFGFDNPDALWEADDINVLLIGDSYTHGVCVEGDAGIAGQLRKRWSTLNLGLSGAGPLMELAVLREYGAHKMPRRVVWIYYEGNDLIDLGGEENTRWLLDYLEPEHTQTLIQERSRIDPHYVSWLDSVVAVGPSPITGEVRGAGPTMLVREMIRLRALRQLLRFGLRFPRKGSDLGALPTVLTQAKQLVESWGGQFVLVYLPAYVRYDSWIGSGPRGYRELTQLARSEAIPLVDLDPVFRATGDPRALWAHPRGHLNSLGYQITATAVALALDSLEAQQ